MIGGVVEGALGAVAGAVSNISDWEKLPMAAFDGVEFPLGFSTRRGGHDIARHKYPGLDKQATEQFGRTPYIFDLEIPLYASINPDHYPKLRRQLEDTWEKSGGACEYTDPEYGPYDVRVVRYDWQRDPMRRNGGIYRVTVEEHWPDFEALVGALLDARGLALAQAGIIDAGLEDAGISRQNLIDAFDEGGFPLTEEELDCSIGDEIFNMVDTFFETIESGAMMFDEISASVDAIRWRVDRIKNFDALQEISRWSILHSLTGIAATCSDGAEKSYAKGPAIIEWTVPKKMSSLQISNKLYGTAERAEEIEMLNPVRNPLHYPKGKVLLVYSE